MRSSPVIFGTVTSGGPFRPGKTRAKPMIPTDYDEDAENDEEVPYRDVGIVDDVGLEDPEILFRIAEQLFEKRRMSSMK